MTEALSIDKIFAIVIDPVFGDLEPMTPGRVHGVFTASLIARAAYEGTLDLESETFAQDVIEVVRQTGNPLHLARAEIVFSEYRDIASLVMQSCRIARDLNSGAPKDG